MKRFGVLSFLFLVSITVPGLGADSSSASTAKWQQDLKEWTLQFHNLVKVLNNGGKNGECGNCSFWLEGAADNTTQYTLNLLESGSVKPMEFDLNSPVKTQGRTRVVFDQQKNEYIYSESDFAGWVNLKVSVSGDGHVAGISLYKTLPNGTVYDKGTTCGNLVGSL